MRQITHRPLAIITASLFLVSAAFPAVAAFVKDTKSWPRWWGMLDVALASFLAVLVLVIHALARGKVNKQAEETSYRVYRLLTHGIFISLVVFFLFGDRIVWANCLTGFAWRTWLLLCSPPAWIAVFKSSAA